MAMSFLGIFVLVGLIGIVGGGIALLVLLVSRSGGSNQASNPNLAPCPDCGRAISVRALVCPHCGGPVQGK